MRIAKLMILAVVATGAAAGSAVADTVYTPSSPNGQKVYLSQACHDRGTGVCHTNTGCNSYSENAGSAAIAKAALTSSSAGLLNRGYTVRIGNGLTSQNISNSNAWRATMHIPIHSNAGTWNCTAPFNAGNGGTMTMYYSTNGSQLAQQLLNTISPSSPGTRSSLVRRTDLGELTQTNAVAGYIEAAYHTYRPDVDWLRQPASWSWRIGYGVDLCRGYPRNGRPTATKRCTW
jgi:hypothetical protein